MRNTLLIPLMLLLSVTVKADLNKMSDSGETIAPDSEVWSCVLDDKTSLIWEVKSEKKGVQYALNTYTWFDGESGRDNGTFSKNCYWGKNCNTQSFIKDINKAELCGYSNWRLPTRDELNSQLLTTTGIVIYSLILISFQTLRWIATGPQIL